MKIIIFGAGQAGYTAARRLKQNMPEAEVLIFDHDACGLYAKMRLPDYVAGKVAREKLILASGDAMRSQGIEPHLGENIERIDPAGKEIFTSAGEAYSYDILILASGAKAFVPPVKGVENVDVFTLRTMEDADQVADRKGGTCDRGRSARAGSRMGFEGTRTGCHGRRVHGPASAASVG